MGEPYTGGCACGAIRYEIKGEPLFCNDCQCRQCQHESGTGHGSHLSFSRSGAEVAGQAGFWEMTADSGAIKVRAFCPICGAPVYQTYPAKQDVITIRAASLDDPGRYRPQVVTYASGAYIWDHLDPDLPKFERMPPG